MSISLQLPDGTVTTERVPALIGRALEADIKVPEWHNSVSRNHARIYVSAGRYYIEDLGSSNGTKVDGIRITGPTPLTPSCRLSLGEVEAFLTLAAVQSPAPGTAGLVTVVMTNPPVPPSPAPHPAEAPAYQPPAQQYSPPAQNPIPPSPAPAFSPRHVDTVGAVKAGAFRHPGEVPALILAVSIVLGVLFVAVPIFVIGGLISGGIGFILDIILGIPLILLWTVGLVLVLAWERRKLETKYPCVTASNYPDVYAAAQSCAHVFGMTAPHIYIATDQGTRNAFATGVIRPIVVIHQGLIGALTPPQLAFVIGHEFGHIKASHLTLTTILRSPFLHQFIGLLVWWPCLITLHLALLLWDRVGEHTADRAGLLACGNLGAAVGALTAVEYGPAEAARLNLAAFVADASRNTFEGIEAVTSTHPSLRRRVNDLVRFVRSGRVRTSG
ncbi:M48 family metalloprotease [bacterium]|nr:M48 family metalloprotease [bacterium]